MLEEGGDYWKNGKAGKKTAKKGKKEMITSSPEKGSIQPECSSNIMFNIFVNLTLRQNPSIHMLITKVRIHGQYRRRHRYHPQTGWH